MRTLSRPMLNMGGPIKQGIMDGIREPYAGGGQAGAGLVGHPAYPKTGGREHHVAFIPPLLAGIATAGRLLARPFGKYVMKQLPKFQKIKWTGRGKTRKALPGAMSKQTTGVEKFEPTALGRWFGKDPLVKAGMSSTGYLGKGLKKGYQIGKAGLTTPTGLAATGTAAYMFWPDGTPKTTEELIEDNVIRRGDKDYGPYTKGKPTITAAMREEKAKADKEKRINALLDTMGYDKSRKDAAYNALIDAGRMVSERGTLEAKNIGRELIDPIVAATSARFDKPEQIREAVGLMQTKADIQKEMTKDETALANQVKRMNLRIGEKTLAGDTLEETIAAAYQRHGAFPSGANLAQLARTKGLNIQEVVDTGGDDIGDAVEYMEGRIAKNKEAGIDVPPGLYVVKDSILIIDAEGNVSRR